MTLPVFCGNTIFTICFSFTLKDSFGMIIQSESCKFALKENLSSSSRTAIFTCSRSYDPRLFYLCLSLSLSLSFSLSSFSLLTHFHLFPRIFLSAMSNGDAHHQVKSLKSILL